MAARHLSVEPLVVGPRLVGAPLASPRRRMAAFAIDLALLALPSLVLAIAVAIMTLRLTDPMALQWFSDFVTGKPDAMSAESLGRLAPALVRAQMPGLPAAVIDAVEHGDLDRAGDLLSDLDLDVAILLGPKKPAPPAGHLRIDVDRFITPTIRVAASYGLGALYFSLLVAGRRGNTLGKKLLGIEVVRLDDRPLTVVESFERFLGYWQVPASLGTALLDFWRDPNRRLPHDRLVNTVVIRMANATLKQRPRARQA